MSELRNLKRAIRRLERFERDAVPKAAAKALNRTATTARKEIIRFMSKRLGLRQKDVRDGSSIKKAKPDRLVAEISFRTKPFNMIRFKARQTRKGVTAAPFGSRRFYRRAFIATMPSGARIVVKRKRAPGGGLVRRLPIRAIFGPSLAALAESPEIEGLIERTMKKRFPEEFERDVRRRLDRIIKSAGPSQ